MPHRANPPRRPARSRPTRAAASAVGGLIIGGRVVAALVSLSIVVGAGYAWASYRQFATKVTRVEAINSSHKPKIDVDGKTQNILLVGIDDRDTISAKERKEIGVPSDGGSFNTDTMMILHVPADGKAASVISFPRDTWVQIAEGGGMAKLNAAYGAGVLKYGKSKGWQVLVETLQDMTGLTIDHFVAVNLYGFYSISRAVGGVTVCLNQAYTREQTKTGVAFPKGRFTVEGRTAVAFVRQRHPFPRGDLDRIVRQQYLLSAMFRKITSAGILLNPLEMQKLVSSIADALQLDKGLDVLKLAQQISDLTAGKLKFTQIPTVGDELPGPISIQRATVDVPTFVRQYFGLGTGTDAYAKAKTVAPATVRVDVRNGAGVSQWAATNAGVLAQAGFVTSTGDWASTQATTILYRPGQEAQAKTLARYVPGATVTESTSVRTVTLVLGRDGTKVRSTPTTAKPKPTGSSGGSGNPTDNRTAAQADCIN